MTSQIQEFIDLEESTEKPYGVDYWILFFYLFFTLRSTAKQK